MNHIIKRQRTAGGMTRKRGTVLLMSLLYTLMFGALATSMVAFSMGNMQLERAETDSNNALAAAESGMSYLSLLFRSTTMPTITEGSIASMSTPSTLWSGTTIESISGNNGIGVALASAINSSGALPTGTTVTSPTGTAPLQVPSILVNPSNTGGAAFSLRVVWDAANPYTTSGTNTSYAILHCTSTGLANYVSRTVTMDIYVQKTLRYAVYSNVAIQLGKNVRVIGDIASTYNGTGKGPPVQMFSDFHYLPNMTQMDSDLATLRSLLATYDSTHANRMDVHDPNSAAAKAAAAKGLVDLNGDGYIDDYDVALKNLDTTASSTNLSSNQITSSAFINPNTGQAYDPDLWTMIDDPEGHLNSSGQLANGTNAPWTGYDDNVINNQDGYAKVKGTVKMALTYSQFQSAASGWSQWGDTSGGSAGTSAQDMFEGPVVAPNPNTPAVQFGANFSSQTLTPQNFDTSSYDAKIPSGNAAVSGSNISNGTLTAAMANGGTTTEHSPADVTSGWQATYSRPVFQNMNFTNVRIPQGLNAKFINCTFNGYTSVKLNTNITKAGTSTTTYDPTDGKNWAQQMTAGNGSFSANTTLTSSNSVAYQNGNNLHFSGCNFNGPITADTPTAYTHFADSWEFDGNTTFNNTVDSSVTIEAPNTNIEMGSFQAPGANPSTLVGVVVAGNIDIRGSANVDGSLIVTGAGATNTTLGYFGSTDQGQAVPPLAQLPTEANGQYGHLFFQFNSNRGMPNGIAIPVVATAQTSTYRIQ